MGDERIFDAATRWRKANGCVAATSARPPSAESHGRRVERKQRPPPLGAEPLKTCAAFHGGEVNETNRARGLLSDMQPYIGLRRSGPTKAHSACASAGYVGDIQRDWKSCSIQ